MGESACLLRSFSHPSDASREAKEGDPIRALGDSISFGRFMSESLAWEKWSAFSHNRYLEEVEKFSKPGSVAQKKAYFEAHYKRKAAQKAAAVLEEANAAAAVLEEANAAAAMTQVETEDRSCISPCMDLEPMRPDNQVIETDERQDFVQNAEFVSTTDVGAHDSMNEESVVETDKVEEEEEEEVIDQNNFIETSPNVESANLCENVEDHDKTVVAEDNKTPADPDAGKEIIVSSGGSLKRLRNYSSKLLTRSWSSKPQSSPAKQATSSHQPMHKSDATPKSKKYAGNIAERLTMKSVHMSMHFNSRLKETSKTSPDLPQIGRKRTHTSSLAISKETPTPPPKIANRASVNGLLKQPWIKPPLESRRCLKSSNSSGTRSKERPPLICSPFSFLSEGRVAKRKEAYYALLFFTLLRRWLKFFQLQCSCYLLFQFFQKLEEKAKSKEAEQKQSEARCQERKKNDITKLRQSRNLEARANQDSNSGSKSPTDVIKKIPITRPRSPKLGRKSASSGIQNIGSLPPRGPSVPSNNSKNIVRKRYEGPAPSVTSLGKKMNACENFSPNIQS